MRHVPTNSSSTHTPSIVGPGGAEAPTLSRVLEVLDGAEARAGERVPQRISTSLAGLSHMLAELFAEVHASRVMLVVDRGALEATGAEAELRSSLGDTLAAEFDAFTPNPTSDQAAAAARLGAASGVDAVVAFGGGSCLDVAKVSALSVRDPARAVEHSVGGDARGASPIPVIAIPTTSGTGSETTHFASIYVKGKKASVAHPAIRPWGVVLDEVLHRSMPRALAACTGLDALCHAVESRWAAGATPASRGYAEEAARLARAHLEPSVLRVQDEDRRAMMLASHLAGRAINISKTTLAHAISYDITQRTGTPHGLAVALTLGHVAAMNAAENGSSSASKGAIEAVHAAVRPLGVEPDQMPGYMRSLISTLGLPSTLSQAGVTAEMLPGIAASVDPLRASNNPRRFTIGAIREMLARAF